MKERTTRLYTRITPAEKKRIFSLAKRCGLSASEYIRQRSLGFSPREIQPEIFYELVRRIETLYQENGGEELLNLIRDIREELILPGKDREVKRWPPLDSGPSKGI